MLKTLSLSQVQRSADLHLAEIIFFSLQGWVVRLVVIGATASTMVNAGELASPDMRRARLHDMQVMEQVSMVGARN